MQAIIEWLAANQTAITATSTIVTTIATVVLAITTIVYAYHTRDLEKENRLLRRAGSAPDVVAYIATNPNIFHGIDFVLMNTGRGPAKRIEYEIVGGEDFHSHGVRLATRKNTLTLLPQDEAIRTSLGFGPDLLKEPALAPFTVSVSYETLAG